MPRELAPNMQNEFRCLPKGKLPVAEEIWKTTALRIIQKANFAASHQDDIFLLHIFLPHLQNLEALLHSNQQYHWSPLKKSLLFCPQDMFRNSQVAGFDISSQPYTTRYGIALGVFPKAAIHVTCANHGWLKDWNKFYIYIIYLLNIYIYIVINVH